jgi:hypothetical protein
MMDQTSSSAKQLSNPAATTIGNPNNSKFKQCSLCT